MNNLPTMTAREAIKQHIADFMAPRACKNCGCHQRHLTGWSESYVVCVGCEVVPGMSVGKIKASVNKHNRKVDRLARKNWSIGVAVSGFNTNTR